jgi:hypothetical protein
MTIPSQAGSSAARAGGSRSIGPSEWTSTTEYPLPRRPLSRGTIDDTDGSDTPGNRGTAGSGTDGKGIDGIGTDGNDTDGIVGRPTDGIESPAPATPGSRRSRSWSRGLPGSSS